MTARELIDQRLNAENKKAALVDCIQKIRDMPDIQQFDEAKAREWIIRPILRTLGYHGREIVPEYKVKNNEKVDYTLQVSGKNKVFIEAKSPKENLKKKKHQDQLLNYSAQKNPDLAILTNGISWWFYLPRAEGAWNDRKFYVIDILEQEIEDIVDKFDRLLSRENVASGKAVQHAESILEKRQREKAIRENLPEAWNSVIKEPHESLLKILIERVVEICDLKPADDEILEFIKSHHEKWLLSPESGQEVPPPVKRRGTKTLHQTKKQTGTPKRMQISDDNYELKYKYEILVNTANWLIDNGHLKPSECPVKLTSRAKIHFINRMPERAPDLKFWRPQKLKNGLFIEADRSDIAIENAQKLLKKYGYDPEILKIEYTDILKFEDHRTSKKGTTVAEFRHRVLLININRQFREGASLDELYEATRFAWKISKSRAEKAEVILATYQGEIKAAFIADEWLATTSENFPDRKTSPGRFGFIGREASPDIQELYVGKRVPDEYRKRGVANPIRYVNFDL